MIRCLRARTAFQIQALAYIFYALYSTLIEIAPFSDWNLADKRRKRYFPDSMSELHNCFSALLAVMVCIRRVNRYDSYWAWQNEKVCISSLCSVLEMLIMKMEMLVNRVCVSLRLHFQLKLRLFMWHLLVENKCRVEIQRCHVFYP